MAAEPKLEIDSGEPSSPNPPDNEEALEDTRYDIEEDPEDEANIHDLQDQPRPKRKGGRKPIYATVEERKQRNRQAQAAFRERRGEYIKQLESTLKQHEELLQLAQRDKQASAYHSSSMHRRIGTLERILREHGIDVETELRARGEQVALPPEPHLLPSTFHAAGAGAGRPMKQSGTTGNTKLDVLKSKAASVRNSIVSPLNSPQPQASVWNDSSPSSSTVASPAVAQYGPSVSASYSANQSAFSHAHNYYHRQPSADSTARSQMAGFSLPLEAYEPPVHSRHLPVAMDTGDAMQNHSGWHPRLPDEWSISRESTQPGRLAEHSRGRPLPPMSGSYRVNTSQSSPTFKQRSRNFGDDDLTMPEGFSQEIFPLTFLGGQSRFPDGPSEPSRRGTNASS